MRVICDPSPLARPEEYHKEQRDKMPEQFRNYDANCQTDNVMRTYREMHTNQTLEFVLKKKEKWCKFDRAKLTIMEALDMLDDLVDESDPDIDLPNSVHAFQTAERIREVHPNKPWFHLVGLIHDVGKLLALWDEPQWCVVGDTFPVGCRFSEKCVFPETFKDNADCKNETYSTHLGIYEEGCGLDNVHVSWGHDEYMYQVLIHNNTTLPDEGLYMIRYHSLYPWHSGGDYDFLCNNHDRKMLEWIREFNKFDLYSKSDSLPDKEALKPYYQSLIDQYLPSSVLSW